MNSRTLLITGGAGFIGSAYLRKVIATTGWRALNLDKLTYAASPDAVADLHLSGRYHFVKGDICDSRTVAELFATEKPDAIVHFAAETHVDRSIDGPSKFIETNIVGTFTLLEAAARYYAAAPAETRERFRFHHVSTDEVFGSLDDGKTFDEASPHNPNSPYSASKAGSDHLVRAWHKTYGLPILVTHCSNNYGPYQFPEKLIPLMTIRALSGHSLPVYGDGRNIRDWLYVDDHVDALLAVLERGRVGESYGIGGGVQIDNLELVGMICTILDRLSPAADGNARQDLITHVPDRPGHDRRYAMNMEKIAREVGWRPKVTLPSGLQETIAWYLANRTWWEKILAGPYTTERLGLVPRHDAAVAGQ
jgi:dTDP-glucose 4,6-dehydratase